MPNPKVALQLYTVREELKKDFAGTLRAVAEMGYPAVQLSGYGGQTASELKRLLDDLGLAVAGSHVGLDALEAHPDQEIRYCLDVGTIDVVIPAIPAERRQSKEDWLRLADLFDRLGSRCQALGARLSYHNHAFEFEKLDGQFALDLLLGSTSPALLKWEPDVYWIAYGGQDPAAYIRQYAGRTPLVHLKDMAATPDRTFAEVGEGTLDWPAIFAASEESGAEWYIVEQDRWARPALEAAALSLKHLREWGKV